MEFAIVLFALAFKKSIRDAKSMSRDLWMKLLLLAGAGALGTLARVGVITRCIDGPSMRIRGARSR